MRLGKITFYLLAAILVVVVLTGSDTVSYCMGDSGLVLSISPT